MSDETKFQIETEVLKKTEKLNKEAYVLFCALTRYKDKIPNEKTYRFMSDKLYMLYCEEFDRITAPYLITRAQEKYEHKKRRAKFVPRETWLLHRKNLSAKFFIDGVAEEAGDFFAAFKAKLAERKYNRPVRRFFRRLFKRGNPAPATCPRTGVNDLSAQAAPRESLPITTLQACDEVISILREREGLRPPKGLAELLAERQRKLMELHPSPVTYDLQQAPEITAEVQKAAREVLTPRQIAEIARVNPAYAAMLEVTKSVAPNEPPTPQNPRKQGAIESDRVSDETHETTKQGKEKK